MSSFCFKNLWQGNVGSDAEDYFLLSKLECQHSKKFNVVPKQLFKYSGWFLSEVFSIFNNVLLGHRIEGLRFSSSAHTHTHRVAEAAVEA